MLWSLVCSFPQCSHVYISCTILTIISQKPETTPSNATKRPEVVEESTKKNENGKETSNSDQNLGVGNTTGDSKEESDFTPEQDAKLLEMKANGKSTWKEIATELSRAPSDLKKRFKELKANGNAGTGDAGGDNGGPGGGNGETKEGEDANRNEGQEGSKNKKNKGWKGRNDNKQAYGDGSGEIDISPTFTLPQLKELTADDMFGVEELEILSWLVKKEKENGWFRIASGFYDRTGRRVHERDIQERFGEMDLN